MKGSHEHSDCAAACSTEEDRLRTALVSNRPETYPSNAVRGLITQPLKVLLAKTTQNVIYADDRGAKAETEPRKNIKAICIYGQKPRDNSKTNTSKSERPTPLSARGQTAKANERSKPLSKVGVWVAHSLRFRKHGIYLEMGSNPFSRCVFG